MDQNRASILQKCAAFMELETRAAEVITYGVASIGLLGALYKIRPFTKFKQPSDIPFHFIKARVPLQGIVKHIEADHGPLLMVDHKPIVPLPRLSRKKYLPIKLAGVNVTGHGISWLQSVVVNRKITFIPLIKEKDYVNCIVELQQENQEHQNVGVKLTELGFAIKNEMNTKLLHDKYIDSYEGCLTKAQLEARLKRNGYWHFVIHPSFMWKVKKFLGTKLKFILPVHILQRIF